MTLAPPPVMRSFPIADLPPGTQVGDTVNVRYRDGRVEARLIAEAPEDALDHELRALTGLGPMPRSTSYADGGDATDDWLRAATGLSSKRA